MLPRVSVVIPTFNRAKDLKRAVQSVMEQSYTDWEIRIVDNHSTDNTKEIVAAFQDDRIYLSQIRNQGIIAASRNAGIRASLGTYIAFLDADDWWKREKLERSVAALDLGADLVYHNLTMITSETQLLKIRKIRARRLHPPAFGDLLNNGNAILNSSVVTKKNLLTDAGMLTEHPDLIAWEDFDCWLKIARKTDKFLKIDSSLGYYWAGGGNVSNDRRTLTILESFCTRYAADLKHSNGINRPFWVRFARIRALVNLNEIAAAKNEIRQLIREDRLRLKSLLLYFFILLKGWRNRSPEKQTA